MRHAFLLLAAAACTPDPAPTPPAPPNDDQQLLVADLGFEVRLATLDGETVHTWQAAPAEHGIDDSRGSFRRAWPDGEGGIVALIEYGSLWHLGPDSEVRWVVDDGNHHDAEPLPDGGWLSLTSQRGPYPPLGEVYQDAIAWYDADGRWQRTLPLLDLIATDPEHGHRLTQLAPGDDPLHVNAIHRLAADGPDDRFQEGFLLLSLRATSELMVLDPDVERITWWADGPFQGQHDAQRLANGNLLLFDNGLPRDGSRALELSLPDLDVVGSWPVGGHSSCCGTVQRLADGNTVVTVTTEGRAVELTPEGLPVWDHALAVPDAKLFQATRVPATP